MRKNVFMSVIALLIGAYGVSAYGARRITSVRIVLPAGVRWQRVSHMTAGQDYINEWVPKGRTDKNAAWKIMSIRRYLGYRITAKQFTKVYIERSQAGCQNPLVGKLRETVVSGHATYSDYVGCSSESETRRSGITYFRVISGFRHMYVIMSWIGLNPTGSAASAGKVPVGYRKALVKRQIKSEKMIKDGIIICVLGQKDCK